MPYRVFLTPGWIGDAFAGILGGTGGMWILGQAVPDGLLKQSNEYGLAVVLLFLLIALACVAARWWASEYRRQLAEYREQLDALAAKLNAREEAYIALAENYVALASRCQNCPGTPAPLTPPEPPAQTPTGRFLRPQS